MTAHDEHTRSSTSLSPSASPAPPVPAAVVHHFGERLRALRERQGMTQFDLSRTSGISQSTVSALETGKQRPWPSTRKALAAAFNMALDEFDSHTMSERRAEPEGGTGGGTPGATGGTGTGETVLRLIEELHEAQDRIRRSEQQLSLLRRMLDHVPLLLWTTDAELRVMSVTGWASRRLQEWSHQVGTPLAMFYKDRYGITDPEFPPLVAHRRALEGESAFCTYELEGTRLDCVVEPVLDGRRRVVGTIGIAVGRGVTAR